MYVLTDKLSAVLGPVAIGLVLTALEGPLGTAAYRIAIGALALIVGVGLFLLLRVPDARPDTETDGSAAEAS